MDYENMYIYISFNILILLVESGADNQFLLPGTYSSPIIIYDHVLWYMCVSVHFYSLF